MNRWLPTFFFFALVIAALAFVGQRAYEDAQPATTWSELKELIAADKIDSVVFRGETVRAKRKIKVDKQEWITVVNIRADEGFTVLLDKHHVPYSAKASSGCNETTALVVFLPLMALGLLFIVLGRQDSGQSSAAAFGRSPAVIVPEEGTGVSFSDVAGADEAAEELMEVVAFLRTPEKFTSLGGRPPKGVLLVGPPGTGKTLFARAVAGEAGVPFFSISGSEFVEMFVGVGAARVRDLFQQAQEHAPCIIFVDELDAVGRARGVAGPGANDEREQTLNQLLVELDGFDNRLGIIVMAATNRPEILDRALLRAGRFDRQILVDRPDYRGRTAILEVHARKLKLARNVDLSQVARLTPGFAGADLANALNEAALLAARREQDEIKTKDIEDAIERVIAGLEKKNRRLSEHEKRVVAYHECGHAVCAAASPGADPVKKISIIPRGIAALGYTVQMPLEDRYLMTKAELLNRITVLYGGRAAEELVFGDVTTGAHDDIRKATDLARLMVTEYGMSHRMGAVNYAPETQANAFGMGGGGPGSIPSPETAEAIEREIRAIADRCHERALEMLHANRVHLEEMTLYLLDHEVLDGPDMVEFLDRVRVFDDLADPPTSELLSKAEG